MRKRAWIITAIIIFLLISIVADLYYFNKVLNKERAAPWEICYSDFRVFWHTGRDFYFRYIVPPGIGSSDATYGPIYDFTKDFYHFRYSPFIALGFVPFSFLPMGLSLLVFSAISNVVYLLSIIMLAAVFDPERRLAGTRALLVSAAVGLLTFRFYLNSIALGQTDILVAFLWCAFLFFYAKKRDVSCGALFALICQFKPFFLPMILFWTITRRWRLVLSSFAWLAAFLALPMIKVGYREGVFLISEWVRLMSHSVESQLAIPKNQSLIFFARSLGLIGSDTRAYMIVSSISYIGLSALLAAIVYAAKMSRHERGRSFEVAYLIMMVLLCSPLIWKAAFIYTIIPAAYLLYGIASGAKKRSGIAGLCGFFLFTSVLSPDITKYLPIFGALSIQLIPIGAFLLFLSLVFYYIDNRSKFISY